MGFVEYGEPLDLVAGVVLTVEFHTAHGFNEMHRFSKGDGKQQGVPFHAGTLSKDGKAGMSTNGRSMASRVMDAAVELAIEEKSPFPDRSFFLDADVPNIGKEILRAMGRGYAVVLVAEDGTSRVLEPGRKIEPVRNPTG